MLDNNNQVVRILDLSVLRDLYSLVRTPVKSLIKTGVDSVLTGTGIGTGLIPPVNYAIDWAFDETEKIIFSGGDV